jgi:hypothetical protein
MNIVIRITLLRLFYYRDKPVTGGLGRYSQNHRFIIVIRPQGRFVLSPANDKNRVQAGDKQSITGLHIPGVIQIPIVFWHFEIPCLRPAVSSLGACPTHAP